MTKLRLELLLILCINLLKKSCFLEIEKRLYSLSFRVLMYLNQFRVCKESNFTFERENCNIFTYTVT